ncbi:TonB-dependent receptor family protein [Reichenbachiella ulvae]|uniref:TonB-dependent receptor family protein n=1 Tax=Reichenbachiella ulvae TaxID=2980104 RepID=A0ABT3CNE3_9BACT|nr:TonB-dependent receptor family protein [Reichenbachiella ulvae]MCV9385054.1 TonB-dependent receptor family protein [Reichenbachiella ulvae]
MKSYLLLVFSLSTFASFAQISGAITDSNQQSVPYANVLLRSSSDSSLVKGTVTDLNGQFQLTDIQNGHYFLTLTSIGYQDFQSRFFEINTAQTSHHFGQITMREDAKVLEGVEVRAQKLQVEQNPEGMVLNVENSLISKGSSALQLLERSPGVILDQRNQSLTLHGQTGTLIMINSRPVRMSSAEITNLLRGMSADNVKSIELLTNPSSKHDADGGAGIINLVLKKNESEGTNGSFSLTGGYGYGQKEVASINLNHRRGATNLFGSYALSNDDSYWQWNGMGTNDMPVFGGVTRYDTWDRTELNTLSHNLQLGIEREFDHNLFLGSSMMYNHANTDQEERVDTDNWFPNDPYFHSKRVISAVNTWDNLNATVYGESKLSNQGKISADLDYLFYKNNMPTRVENQYQNSLGETVTPANDIFLDSNRGQSETTIHIAIAKADYEQTIGEKTKLETGIKATYSNTDNFAAIEGFQDGQWIVDARTTAQSNIEEKIGAAYASFNFELDSNTHITAGLRYEHWLRDFGDPELDQNNGRLFPTLFVSRALTAKTSLQFAYNRRISRPLYNDLAANLRYLSPTSVFSGNASLKPTITDNFRLSYLINDISLALVYTYEENPIVRHQLSQRPDSELIVISAQNLAYQKNYAIQSNLPIQIAKWWSINTGGSMGYRSFKLSHTEEQIEKTYFVYNTYANSTFSLPWDMSMEWSGFYNSKHYYGSMKAKGFGQVNFGINKNFKDNWGSLQFTINDVFQTLQYQNQYGALTKEAYDGQFNVIYEPEAKVNRIYRLTYSKTFGSNNIKGKKQRKAGANEERSRVNQN